MMKIPDIEALAGDYYIDTNGLSELLDSVTEALDGLQNIVDSSDNPYEVHDAKTTLAEWYAMYEGTYEQLKNVVNDVPRDETMIIDLKIDEYLVEMVYDCYDIPKLPDFIRLVIDYDMLKQDYIEVEFQDNTYFVRSV